MASSIIFCLLHSFMGSFAFPTEKIAVIPHHSRIPPSLIPLPHFGYILMKLFTLFTTNGFWVLRKEAEM
jgi:hypothetical protein